MGAIWERWVRFSKSSLRRAESGIFGNFREFWGTARTRTDRRDHEERKEKLPWITSFAISAIVVISASHGMLSPAGAEGALSISSVALRIRHHECAARGREDAIAQAKGLNLFCVSWIFGAPRAALWS